MSAAPLLRVENLCYTPRTLGDPFVPALKIEGISLTLAPGESVALLGAYDSGVSLVLRLLAHLLPPQRGRIYLEEKDITRVWGGQLMALRRAVQFVGGDPLRALLPHLTVAETLQEPLAIHRRGSAAERATRVAACAHQLGLHPFLLERRVEALSLALRQRVMLARALTLQPRVLLVDELSDRLEPAAVWRLMENLAHLCRAENWAWLWATTNFALARQFAQRVLRLEGGQLVSVTSS